MIEIRRLSKILLIIIFGFSLSYSQNKVEIKDTSIAKGIFSSYIPIYGTIETSPTNSISLELEYNSKLILIKSIIGANNYALKCTFLAPNPPIEPYEHAVLYITCNDVQAINNGIICVLEVEGLAGYDSVSYITPKKLLIDGVEPQNKEFLKGKITISQIPVVQKYPEGLGRNYPNPFSGSTIFPFTIENNTPVTFKIFSLRGEEIINNSDLNSMFEIEKVTKTGNIKINDLNNPLDKGSYIFIFKPIIWKFGSGGYYLVMQTNRGVYTSSFLYVK